MGYWVVMLPGMRESVPLAQRGEEKGRVLVLKNRGEHAIKVSTFIWLGFKVDEGVCSGVKDRSE